MADGPAVGPGRAALAAAGRGDVRRVRHGRAVFRARIVGALCRRRHERACPVDPARERPEPGGHTERPVRAHAQLQQLQHDGRGDEFRRPAGRGAGHRPHQPRYCLPIRGCHLAHVMRTDFVARQSIAEKQTSHWTQDTHTRNSVRPPHLAHADHQQPGAARPGCIPVLCAYPRPRRRAVRNCHRRSALGVRRGNGRGAQRAVAPGWPLIAWNC